MFLFFLTYSSTLNTDENCKTNFTFPLGLGKRKRLPPKLSTRNYMNSFREEYPKNINIHAKIKRLIK